MKIKNIKLDPKKLYRYHQEKMCFFIDVQLDGYREIYNEWDFSPLYNRDIDEDLVAYLKNSYEEIPLKSEIIISISVPRSERNSDRESKSIESMKNYFMYLIRIKNREMQGVKKRMIYYLVIGAALLSLANFTETIPLSAGYMQILSQGLFVGGWVLFWEVFSDIFFELTEMRKDLKIYYKMYASWIEFRYR
ncbi:MAG: hypothetical protein JXQ26_05185 [Tissierellales bacterium]|nr:hypothetical protein [Tissierellales bacterium]MBN2827357.1 hypothetical protein [Tissierellales bacterium]